MSVKSYLVFPYKGRLQELSEDLSKLPWCQTIPSENREVIVLVTDTKDEKDEEDCINHVNSIESLEHMTLVSGFEENLN